MRADADVPSVSGTLVTRLFEVAREVLGPEVVQQGFSRAPVEAAAAVSDALPGVWVPLAEADAVLRSVAAVAGRDVASLHAELARISVDRALKTIWRLFLRFTTDEALVTRTPVIFGKSYNRGRLVPRIVSPGRGEVELLDWPDVPEWPERGTRTGVETVLRAAGRKDVRVEGRRTVTGALYVATWR